MKLLGKNGEVVRGGSRGGSIDSLLRAYFSRQGNRECSEFDADLANAYIERNLNTASRSRYEQHLSECTPCRKNVVALSRLVETESRPLISARGDGRPRGRQIFGITSWARWSMAAAAVIVFAISLPLLLTRNSSRVAQESPQAAAESQAGDNIQAASSPEKSLSATAKQSAASSPESADATKPSEKRRVDAASSNGPASTEQPAGAGGDRAALGGKLEAKTEPKPTEQVQAAAGSQPVSEVASGQAQQEKRSDKDGSTSARQQQPSQDIAATDTKSSGSEQDKQNAKEKTQVDNAATPPPPAAPSVKAGKMKRSSAIRALRDSNAPESVRPTEKKLGNKKFSLKNDTWTDKDFDPDKDLPIVTVIRDSNVYNELIATRAGLKPYLGGFPAAERAIIVYKGTVYKLIPQQ
jgi:hypothetical protein